MWRHDPDYDDDHGVDHNMIYDGHGVDHYIMIIMMMLMLIMLIFLNGAAVNVEAKS